MSDEPKSCDLCRLPVEVPDFTLETVSGVKQFCCEGCQGIYRMMHQDQLLQDETTD